MSQHPSPGTSSAVADRIVEIAKQGFSGTNAQWAVKVGAGPQTTWNALQRLVARGQLISETVANRTVVYGLKPSVSMSLVGRTILIDISPAGEISARWG